MVWKGEAACLVGITAFVLMAIIALTSIPSVGESLNWSEWRCIHSNLSYFVLLLTVAHVCIMGAPGWCKVGFVGTLRSITFLSIILPLLVLFLKFIFMCPPLRGYIRKIRRGWERNTLPSGDADRVQGHDNNGKAEVDLGAINVTCCCDKGPVVGAEACDGCRAGVFSVTVHCECSSV